MSKELEVYDKKFTYDKLEGLIYLKVKGNKTLEERFKKVVAPMRRNFILYEHWQSITDEVNKLREDCIKYKVKFRLGDLYKTEQELKKKKVRKI